MQTSLFLSKFDIQSAGLTLKMRSRSPKSNHFFPMSQWCFYARLVKIHQLVKEMEGRQGSFYNLYSVVTLKIRSRSPKSDQIFKPSQCYNIWSLVRIHHSVQDAHKLFLGQIVWSPWKLGQGHQNLIKSLNHPSVTIYEVWPESIIWLKRKGAFLGGKNLKISVLVWPWK